MRIRPPNAARRAAGAGSNVHGPVGPPSTVYAAANRHRAPVEVVEHAFNEHEGGQGVHWQRQAAWLAERMRQV